MIGLVLAPINAAEAPVGLVRPERALRRPADVRAALADPLLDEPSCAALSARASDAPRRAGSQPLVSSSSCSRSWAASSIALWRHSLAR